MLRRAVVGLLPVFFARQAYSFSTLVTRNSGASMRVVTIPLFADNYSYMIVDEQSNSAAVVDAAEPDKVAAAIKAEVHHKHERSCLLITGKATTTRMLRASNWQPS
jgi:hypothetical protein